MLELWNLTSNDWPKEILDLGQQPDQLSVGVACADMSPGSPILYHLADLLNANINYFKKPDFLIYIFYTMVWNSVKLNCTSKNHWSLQQVWKRYMLTNNDIFY